MTAPSRARRRARRSPRTGWRVAPAAARDAAPGSRRGCCARCWASGVASRSGSTQDDGLSTAREADLVRILDDVTSAHERLAAEARDLQATRDRLASGSGQRGRARRGAQAACRHPGHPGRHRAAPGPGHRADHHRPEGKVDAAVLLDALAGAARRRRRGDPDRRRSGWSPRRRSPTAARRPCVGRRTAAPAAVHDPW